MANWKRIIHGDSHMPIHMQWSMRWYLGAYPSFSGTSRRRWMCPSTVYGANYYQWSSYYTNANPRTNWYKTYNPCIVAPCDAIVKEWYLIGNLVANVTTGLDGGDIKIQLDTTETSPSYDNTTSNSALAMFPLIVFIADVLESICSSIPGITDIASDRSSAARVRRSVD